MSSKARARLQSLNRKMMLIAGIVGAGLVAGAAQTMPDGRPTPTGLEVPRWLSLKSSHVRARSGPGLDYRILWEYRAARLPVQVIAETREWRKVCDPEGSVVWVHRSVVSSRRSIFNAGEQEIDIHARRSETSPVRARLQARSLLSVKDCEDGWCQVRFNKRKGWVQQGKVFGTSEAVLCDASRVAGVRSRDDAAGTLTG